MANIEMQLGGVVFMVETAMSDPLPMSVFGKDVPQLVELQKWCWQRAVCVADAQLTAS